MDGQIDVAVIGGGQAGLSVSWYLKSIGLEHVVFDRGRIGDAWRQRWDSFCLVTPNWTCRLPEFPYDGNDPDGFMLRDEIVNYVKRFAASFDPPLLSPVEVRRIGASSDDRRFLVETSEGVWSAERVIIAVGTYQQPNIPSWAERLSGDIVQLHSRGYRNPDQLPEGAVLVIGSGQSGCQVAEDLHLAGRKVHLSVGRAPRLPRRYRGHDILRWMEAAGLFTVPVDEHPDGTAIRFKPHAQLSGRDGGRDINLRRFALEGIELHGRVVDARGRRLHVADDLAESLDAADEACLRRLEIIDKYIAKAGIDAPENDLEPVEWQPGSEPGAFDLEQAGINSVIYGTGFRYDFGWIDYPIFDERGYPRYRRGVTEVPGLYFAGLHWLHTWGSGLFYDVARDAEYVVNHLHLSVKTRR